MQTNDFNRRSVSEVIKALIELRKEMLNCEMHRREEIIACVWLFNEPTTILVADWAINVFVNENLPNAEANAELERNQIEIN